MWMIVGLGNPGKQYEQTRHNVGFMALNQFAQEFGSGQWKSEKNAEVMLGQVTQSKVLLVKPQSFMNLSGEPVQNLMHFYKIPLSQLIVLHDEVDAPFLKFKIQHNRGHGGHNGVRSISGMLGSTNYFRIRIGVGRPPVPQMDMADWVLSRFSKEEQQELPGFLKKAVEATKCLMEEGISIASTRYAN